MTGEPPGPVGLVVVAAGSGDRLGFGVPKALVQIAGRTLLGHCLHNLAASVDVVVIVGPVDRLAEIAEEVDRHLRGLAPTPGDGGDVCVPGDIRVVAGGAERMDSVAAGLEALPDDVGIVAIHDAARPLVEGGVLLDAIRLVGLGADAVAPAVEITDTIKSVHPGGDRVAGTPRRDLLRAVQTPQVFRRAALLAAHEHARKSPALMGATDDLFLVEQQGGEVRLLPGSRRYLKVTHPEDVLLVEAMAADPSLGRLARACSGAAR